MRPVVTTTAAPSVAGVAPAKVDPRLVASLAAVYLIWSSTYLAMRIVVHDLPPLLSAALRFSVEGSVPGGYAIYKGARVPRLRDWLRIARTGVFLCVGGNGFGAIASRSIP